MEFNINQIQAKSILQKSGLPDTDWVINPYMGCRFACKYCYAAFVGKFWHKGEEWGSYVDVKINAPELLKKELQQKLKEKNKKDIGTILFSSVTDPYQGLEAKYKLTRQCLQVLADLDYKGNIGILTKSHLVLRDIDLFKKLKNIEVGLTVTSTDDQISRYLETFATPNKDRINILRELHKQGIKTYAFVGPLLPHFVWMKNKMEDLLKQLKEAGVSYIYLEHINLSPYIKDRLFNYLKKDHPDLLKKFQQTQSPEYREKLSQMLLSLAHKIGLKIAHEQPIYHISKESWKKLRKK